MRQQVRPWQRDSTDTRLVTNGRTSTGNVTDELTATMIGDAIAVDRATVQRWLAAPTSTMTTFRVVDVACCRLGVHPAFVYGDLYWDHLHHTLERLERQRLAKNAQSRRNNAARREAHKSELAKLAGLTENDERVLDEWRRHRWAEGARMTNERRTQCA